METNPDKTPPEGHLRLLESHWNAGDSAAGWLPSACTASGDLPATGEGAETRAEQMPPALTAWMTPTHLELRYEDDDFFSSLRFSPPAGYGRRRRGEEEEA